MLSHLKESEACNNTGKDRQSKNHAYKRIMISFSLSALSQKKTNKRGLQKGKKNEKKKIYHKEMVVSGRVWVLAAVHSPGMT